MNFLKTGFIIAKSMKFMNSYSKLIGDPVHLSPEEYQSVLDNIKSEKIDKNRFYLVLNLKKLEIVFSHNVENFFNHFGEITLEYFFKNIHKDYLGEFISWAETVYMYSLEMGEYIIPLKQTFRILVPLKLKDNQYYWVLQECQPLQVDKENRLVSHLNTYSIIQEYSTRKEWSLLGEIWDENFKQKAWSKTVKKRYFFSPSVFTVTPKEREILLYLLNNPNASNKEIGLNFNITTNTVNVHTKQILRKAKQSFPLLNFITVREVSIFFTDLGFLKDNFDYSAESS